MSNTSRLTSKGQVTVPKSLRDKYGLHPASEVEFIDDGKGIRLLPADGRMPVDRVYGLLRMRMRTDALITKLRGR